MTIHRLFAGISVLIVGIALVWGAWLVGNPANQRQRRLDDRRVEDLRAIQNEIFNIVYDNQPWMKPDGTPAILKQPLPQTLEDVQAKAYYQRLTITDPDTAAPYDYQVIDATNFELCALFSQPRQQEYDIFWDHPAGRHCYSFDVTDMNRR